MNRQLRRAGRVLLGLLVLVVLGPGATGQITVRPPARPTAAEPPVVPGMNPTPGPLPTRGSATVSDPPTPQVSIRVRVPAVAHAGKELEYHFFVQNLTPGAAAHHVRVRAPYPKNCTFVRTSLPLDESESSKEQMIWKLGTMPGGTSKEITVVVVPTGTGDPECCARVQFEHGECVQTRLTQSHLRVRLLGPTQVLLNDLPRFQIEVTNSGQREATGVSLTNTLPEGLEFIDSTPKTDDRNKSVNPLTWTLGTLPPGQSKRIDLDILAKTIGTQINKVALKDSTGPRGEDTLKVHVVEPKLDLTLTGPQRRLLGRPAVYNITISNPGTAPASNVEVWSILPEKKIEFVNASIIPQQIGKELRWKLGTLPPGARQTIQATFRANEEGQFTLGINSTAERLSLVKKLFLTFFAGASNLSAEIDKDPDPLEVGKAGTYTLRLINQGSAASMQVKAVLTFPEELQIQGANGGTVPARTEGQKVIVELASLAAGGEVVVKVTAQARKAGDVRLSADVTAEELKSGPIHFEESATLHSESLVPSGGSKP